MFYNVQTHIEKERMKDLLENHLPKNYAKKVISKLSEEKIAVDSQFVRTVKGGFRKDVIVFNAIIEVATEAETISKRIKKNLKPAV